MEDPTTDSFTFIVVGSGSSGMMLVHELAKTGNRNRGENQTTIKILLLERGSRDCDQLPLVKKPGQWGAAACSIGGYSAVEPTSGSATGSQPTVQHESAKQTGLYGRNLRCPVGNGVGGSSNINAMLWTPGHRGVFDKHWPRSWSSDTMDRLFQRVLSVVHPQRVGVSSSSSGPCCHLQALIRHAASHGRSSRNKDEEMEIWADATPCCTSYLSTVTPVSSSDSAAERLSLRERVLEPLLRSTNSEADATAFETDCPALGEVTLLTCCEVIRVLFEAATETLDNSDSACSGPRREEKRKHATGVLVKDHVTGLERVFRVDPSRGEVILCAGVFGSPRILSRSLPPDSLPLYSTAATHEVESASKYGNKASNAGDHTGAEGGGSGGGDDMPWGRRLATPGVGSPPLDHSVLPFMALGNWWALRNAPPEFSSDNGDTLDVSRLHLNMPPNSVHGWIYLDHEGRQLLGVSEMSQSASTATPSPIASCQLLFVDGRVLPGMFCAQVLPHFSGNVFYTKYVRPFLVFLLQCLVSLRVVNWLLSCTFGVLLCRMQPPLPAQHCREHQKTQPQSVHSSDVFSSQRSQWEERIKPMKLALAEVRSLCQRFRSHTGGAFWYVELLPGPLFLYCCSDKLFSIFYKCFLGTYYHYCGTCKMGSASPGQSGEKDRVVDESLRVLAVDGLRIADASVFPWIPSAPIAATTMAVGVRAAELLLDAATRKTIPKRKGSSTVQCSSSCNESPP